MKYVSDNSKIPVFAHYYKTKKEIEKIIELKAAKGIWMHIYRMGGFHLCAKIADLAKKNNLGLHIGNGGFCGITITAAAQLAAGTENVLCSIASGDLKYPWLRIVSKETMPILEDGARIPSERPGLGIELRDGIKEQIAGKIEIKLER
jgi:L-alanine-DL-glutamate epimerase-like enolase superfamily enzyme